MDHELSALGLTTPQYAALAALQDTARASSAELARRCFVTPPSRPRPAADRRWRRGPMWPRAALQGAAAVVTYNRVVVDGVTGDEVDRVFHALADATRRDILHRCIRGEPSVSRIADAYPMSFAAVQKHVAVLERAGLVTKERRGREQLVHTDGDSVGRARRVLDELEEAWRGRVDRMADLLR